MTTSPVIRVLNWIFQKAILLMSIVIMGYLSYHALRYVYAYKDLNSEYLEAYLDAPRRGILIVIAVMVLFGILTALVRRLQKRNIALTRWLLPILMIASFVISVIWVKISKSHPYNDQLYLAVCAADFINGNFEQLESGGFAGFYPHQLPLIFVIECLFRLFHTTNYAVFQYLNACMMPLMIWGGYLAVGEMFERKEEIRLIYLLLMAGCLPLYLYVPYVYGEVGSMTFLFWEVWSIEKFLKTNRARYAYGMIAFAVLAFIFRKNTLIFMIAAGIVLVWYAILQKKAKALVGLVAMVLAVVIVQHAVTSFYELRSGIDIGKGIPSTAWVAMGLQDTWPNAGWYNNMNREIYQVSSFNTEIADSVSKSNIKARLQELKADPAYMMAFFQDKLLTQWNEPTFGAFTLNNSFAEEPVEGSFVYNVFYGELNTKLFNWMNYYHLVIFVLFYVALIVLLFRRTEPMQLLVAITFIGGFLFSLLWEAKSRYNLPYMVLMIPCSAAAVSMLADAIVSVISSYFASRPEMLDAARIDRDTSINDATLGGFDDRRAQDREKTARFYFFRRKDSSQDQQAKEK